eukprot:6478829-Amphidinium_carterae.1
MLKKKKKPSDIQKQRKTSTTNTAYVLLKSIVFEVSFGGENKKTIVPVSYTHLRAHETEADL